MNSQIITILVIGALMVAGFAVGRGKFAAVAIGVIIALNVTGILSFTGAWAGYASTTAVLFASMFVLAAALSKTSLLGKIAGVIVPDGSSERRAVIGCGLITIILSILGNTSSAIATVMPIVFKVAEKAGISPKRILKPLVDVSAIWVGVLPLGVGMAAYSIANDMLVSFGGQASFNVTTFMIGRLPVALVTTALVLLIGYRFSPKNLDGVDYAGMTAEQTASADKKPGLSPRKEKAVYIIYIVTLITMIASAAIRAIDAASCAAIGALLMVFTGVLTEKEAFRSINLSVISLYCGTIALATGLSESGATEIISDWLQSLLGGMASPFAITLVLFIVTAVATQFLNNTSASNIFLVVGVIVSVSCGFDARAVLVAVSLGATMPGVVPMASATEALVFAQGGYTMKEYLKAGSFTFLVYSLLTMAWAPFIFPAV